MFQRLAGTKPSTLGIAIAIPQASCQVVRWFQRTSSWAHHLGEQLRELQLANGKAQPWGTKEKASETSECYAEDSEF